MPSAPDLTLVSQFQPKADEQQGLEEPGEVALHAGNVQDHRVWVQQMRC